MDPIGHCETFRILSSDSKGAYDVTCSRLVDRIVLSCTCKSGVFGQLCRHKLAVLRGEQGSLDASNCGRLELVEGWVNQTVVRRALDELAAAEKAKSSAEERLKIAKGDLRQLVGG